jgi:HTH-type transcriptional regulator/antitoxin HigA
MTDMAYRTATADRSGGRAKYLALVQHFPLRPLRSEEELDEATEVLNSLLDRDLDPWEDDYLEILGDLIEKYESATLPEGDISDADMLQHLIEAKGVTQARVAADTGIAESTISAVIRGKRRLARKHLETLSRYFRVSPAVFLSASPR